MYHENTLVSKHVRSYDRRKDFENPDHVKPLLEYRKKARGQKIFMRFLALSDKAEAYYLQLKERRMNPFHHVQKIVALSEIYPSDAVKQAMADAFEFEAFSCEYIANILEMRARFQSEPGALHLTRKTDLLDLTIESPDLSLYTIDTEGA